MTKLQLIGSEADIEAALLAAGLFKPAAPSSWAILEGDILTITHGEAWQLFPVLGPVELAYVPQEPDWAGFSVDWLEASRGLPLHKSLTGGQLQGCPYCNVAALHSQAAVSVRNAAGLRSAIAELMVPGLQAISNWTPTNRTILRSLLAANGFEFDYLTEATDPDPDPEPPPDPLP